MATLLKVRLSLKGRPLRTYTFTQKSIEIGRDPASDVFLDNTGISRCHARIELTPGGYVVEDLGSANGTFVNDSPVKREYVGHNDVVQIGKFALWLGVDSDRRERTLLDPAATGGPIEGTTVLSAEQMLEFQRKSREEATARSVEPPPAPEKNVTFMTCLALSAACFLLGLCLGAVVTFVVTG